MADPVPPVPTIPPPSLLGLIKMVAAGGAISLDHLKAIAAEPLLAAAFPEFAPYMAFVGRVEPLLSVINGGLPSITSFGAALKMAVTQGPQFVADLKSIVDDPETAALFPAIGAYKGAIDEALGFLSAVESWFPGKAASLQSAVTAS